MTMISALPKMEEGFLAPTKHSERKKRASVGMTGGRRILLVLALMAWFAGRAEAQAVPSLESIQS